MAGNSLTYANLLKEMAAQPPTQAQRDAANKALRLGNSLSLLNGYYGLTANQQDAFKTKYWEKAVAHNFDSGYLDTIFRNHLFIDRFGMARFKKLESPGERDALLKHNIVGTEFDKRFINEDAQGKVNNNLGMGDQFRYYRSRLSDDAKMELLKSNYLSPAEIRKDKEEQQKAAKAATVVPRGFSGGSASLTMGQKAFNIGIALTEGISSLFGSDYYINPSGFKGEKMNQKILDDIYSKDIKRATSQLDPVVAQEYTSLKLNDKQTEAEFKKECLPRSYKDKDGNPNLGIPSFAKYFQGEESFADMEAMTTDEKRKFIARKRAYEKYLPADMVSKTLDDDARDWLAENQPWLRRQWLRTKDVGISAMAYGAQIVDGTVAEPVREGLDVLGAKPKVWMDGENNIIDTTKHPILQNPISRVHFYLDDKGHSHQVHQMEIDNTALHQLGKEANGSDIKGALGTAWLTTNPMYWNRAEQFKTLDEDEQKQYEKLGVSPYDVAYAHNDSAGILWESAKMMSFGLVDGVLNLIPWGLGAAGLKLMSTAGKLGKLGVAANALGKTLQGAGALLGTSKFGQYFAATRGALGIADAYQSGAFLETLQQNYENLDKAVEDRATKEIEEMYQNDPSYRKDVEFAVQQRVPQIEATLKKQEQYRGYTEEGLKDLAHKLAKEQIISGDIQRRKEYIQDSKDYADAQQEAIQGASNTAKNVFLTEGLKYGFVNAFGHRSYLFKNPQGATRAVSNSLKGIKEITTSAGKKRLVSKAMENLSTGQAKRFGKVLGKQVWGGAWTNGTDDMQVEAAEEINKDSYGRYLDAWRNGEAQAETYGITDGIYSYLTGLMNSATEEHTLRAATVGGLGSVINVLPNFTNIASLMTKEGREHFKNNFERKKIVDAEGNIVRDEGGNIKYEDTKGNWKEKAAFFIQNGVLNEYYGKYQAARDQQDHVDFVNRILNDYDDFKAIERLVASNIAGDNLNNVKDAKTANFIKAITAVHMLNALDKGKDDPSSLSSVVQEAKSTIQKAAALNLEKGENPFTEEETQNLLGQYYSSNPGVMQSEEENINALNNISKNAKELLEAEKAYTKAYKEVEKIERSKGPIDPRVKQTLIEQKALLGHWKERNAQMKSEIDDNSTDEMPKDPDIVVAAIGGKKNALNAIKVYDLQLRELREEYADQEAQANKAKEDLQKAIEDLKKAQDAKEKASNDTEEKTADDAIEDAKKNIKVNAVIYDNLQNQSKFLQSTITSVEEKRNTLQSSIDAGNVARNESQHSLASTQKVRLTKKLEELNAKKFKKDGGVNQYYTNHPDELAQLDSEIESTKKELQRFSDKVDAVKDKVLTADEIMSLDPVTRAKMMHKDNRKLYSAEQRKEIEKLETELQQKDADALQKIQDIGSLTRRIATTEDAYSRISQSPEAAAYQYDIQETLAAQLGHDLINYNNAELLSKSIYKIIKEHEKANNITLSDAEKSETIYRGLRSYPTRTLDIIEKEGMMPKAVDEVHRAKEWAKTLDDISAVIYTANKPEDWKKNMASALDSVLKGAKDKADLMTQLEKIVDDTEGTETSKDVELVLQGLEKLDYQRNTSMVEAREKRKERELKQQREREEKQRKIEEAAKKAAEKKAAEEQQKQEEKTKQEAEKKKQEEERKKNIPKEDQNPKDSDDKPGNIPSGVAPVEDNDANPEDAIMAEEVFRNEERERTTPEHQIPADGKGLEPVTTLDESDVVPIDGSTVEKTESVQWNAGVDYLMEENAEDATEDAGGIWHNQQGSPSRSTLNVTKKGNTISLDVNGKAETLKITPSEYEPSTEDKENKGKNFIASSIEKKDDGWYFKGNYEDSKESTEVKAKDDFSLDGAIKRLQGERAEEFSSIEDTIEPDRLVVDEEKGTVGVASPSLKDQYKEAQADNSQVTLKEIDTTEPTLEEQNKRQEEINDKNKGCNSGNAMHRYDTPTLRDEGVEKKRVGNNPNDPMNAFYAWLDNAGVKLQNIIDFELAKILQNNPHMKIRYMVVNDQYNATNDHALGNSVMLVVEYDDKVNKGITQIHNEENGGVIEANGKKYLIVGTLGYGKNDPERFSLYKILFNKRPSKTEELGTLLVARNKYFAEHPNERFYVEENYNTEVIPDTLTYGYRVRQRADSTKGANEAVPISELLASKESNSHGLIWDELIFGIQENRGLLLNRSVDVSVSGLHDSMSNMGRVFVFVPNSAGKLFPIALRPTKYSEIKEGALKQKIDTLLMGLLSPEYEQRVAAAVELGRILYLNPKGEFFQIQKNGPYIYFMKNGMSDEHSKIDIRTASIKELREKLEQMNPIINITAKVIKNTETLKMYNDAGALRTDVDLLGTAGSSYNVYAVDRDGKMIIPQKPLTGSSTKSEPDRKQSQVIYNHQFYTELDGQFSLNGVPVTDKDLISQLEYNKRVLDNGIEPLARTTLWNYYVLSNGEHPEVIKINTNSKEVVVAKENEGKALIEKYSKKQENQSRDKEAKREIKIEDATDIQNVDLGDVDNINKDSSDTTPEIDSNISLKPVTPETPIEGPEVAPESTKEDKTSDTKIDQENKGKEEGTKEPPTATTDSKENTPPPLKRGKGAEIIGFINDRKNMRRSIDLTPLVEKKFGRKFNDPTKLKEFLKNHNIEVENIDTSEEGWKAWLHTIEDCR